MNIELITQVVTDLAELTHPSIEVIDEPSLPADVPEYIVPQPPIPGKTAWSIAPW